MEANLEHYMELAGMALRARDTYRFENTELKAKVGQLELDVKKRDLDLTSLTAENAKLKSELEDLQAFNQMLQKMIKKMK